MSPRSASHFDHVLQEPTIIALPGGHALTERRQLRIRDLEVVPLILPAPRTRPQRTANEPEAN